MQDEVVCFVPKCWSDEIRRRLRCSNSTKKARPNQSRAVQGPKSRRDKAPRLVLGVGRAIPIKESLSKAARPVSFSHHEQHAAPPLETHPQALLFRKGGLLPDRVGVVVADEAAVAPDALGGADLLVGLLLGRFAGQVAVVEGAVVAADALELVAGALDVQEGAAVQGDSQEDALGMDARRHQEADRRGPGALVPVYGVQLRVVARLLGPGAEVVKGHQIDEVQVLGGLADRNVLENVPVAGERRRDDVVGHVQARRRYESQKVCPLLLVTREFPVDCRRRGNKDSRS